MIDLAKKFLHENIYFELYHHRAIYTNEDALVIKKEHLQVQRPKAYS